MSDAATTIVENEEEGIRLARRRAVDADVVLSDPEGYGEVALRCRDISVSGLFVYTPVCVRPGNEFVCRLELDGGDIVEALGCVTRVVLDTETPAHSGMGIRFVELAREARERLVDFTAALDLGGGPATSLAPTC